MSRAHDSGGRRIRVSTAAPDELAACQELRRRVFVEGQGVPEALELDGRDADSLHFVAREGDQLVGTARLRPVDGAAKAERVAVLESHRKRGVGRQLMRALEEEARARGLSRFVLNAQLEVVAFYEGLGYAPRGEIFEEAGIPHQRMEKGGDPA